MSLCCPICEGDERFCKEHGCREDDQRKENNDGKSNDQSNKCNEQRHN